MPKAHFKSITVHETIYDEWHAYYEKNKHLLKSMAINSFAAFISMILNTVTEDKEMWAVFINRIAEAQRAKIDNLKLPKPKQVEDRY